MSDCIRCVYGVMIGENIECVCDTEDYANEIADMFNKYYDFDMYYVKKLPILKSNDDFNADLSPYNNPEHIKYLKSVIDGIE